MSEQAIVKSESNMMHDLNNALSYVTVNVDVMAQYIEKYLEFVQKSQQLLNLLPQDMVQAEVNDLVVNLQKLVADKDFQYIEEDCVDLVQETQTGLNEINGLVGQLPKIS